MKKRALTKQRLSLPISIAIGVGISILLAVTAAMLIGSLVLNETIKESTISIASKILLFFVVFIGILIAVVLRNEKIVQVGAISSAILVVIQMLFCAFGNNGISSAMFLNSLIILAGIACAIGIKLSGQKKSNQRKKRYR